ncbi:MAG: flavodoxin-dependent (E)-4-hydroxy-3-methylbut-2-enyl-diphosphate synthase [Candidatus Omnitrophica bacterium]|nr:flavodoxin-dependent (E)-4-hydroxy-3-methylbut-2-enyl-diphosphate synthase [Candidatus Omnitrophota bacterium]
MTGLVRRKTPSVKIGGLFLGSSHLIAVQSMTNTLTADQEATFRQTRELSDAGADLVRWTVNDEAAAQAVPLIVARLRDQGISTPIIGDFHFNGHVLLNSFPECARALDKYRINPGNVGRGSRHDAHFETFIKLALEYDKPVRIGVNSGSLDPDLLAAMTRRTKRQTPKKIISQAMIKSALDSAAFAEKLGLKKSQIVLSVKMSTVRDMVEVYEQLANQCDYVLHLGLTEAGGGLPGVVASSAALSLLLGQGIGDTIRVSLTPEPGVKRAREVEVARHLLQSLGLRDFMPQVISCPGCGRTSGEEFQRLAADVRAFVSAQMPRWKKNVPGVERLKIAVMGCVVNGPGESCHADIGISLPGRQEKPSAVVYRNGRKFCDIKGEKVNAKFLKILNEFIRTLKSTK